MVPDEAAWGISLEVLPGEPHRRRRGVGLHIHLAEIPSIWFNPQRAGIARDGALFREMGTGMSETSPRCNGWQRRTVDLAVYGVVRIVICMVQALSRDQHAALARWVAWLATDVLRVRDQVMEENLQQAFPEASLEERMQLKRGMWKHLILMVSEIAVAPRKIHETNWRRFVTLSDRRALVSRLLEDRPLVMVSGHFGNFEIAGFIAGLLGFPTYAIARPLDNPYLHRFIDGFRRVKGQYMIDKDGSAAEVKEHLDQHRTLLLLADQHAGPKGCWVDFFGRPASCHKAVAVFTLTADAPLLVCYVRRTSEAMHFEVGLAGEIDPRKLPKDLEGIKPITQWYNRHLEDIVRRAPEQYWWLHRRWKGGPPGRQAVAKASRAA